MNATRALPNPRIDVEAFCRKWDVRELALFGSVLRHDFRPDSDVDVLVTFKPNKKPFLLDRVDMVRELEDLFGRPVDLVERQALERSPNYLRRQHVLSTAEIIYGP